MTEGRNEDARALFEGIAEQTRGIHAPWLLCTVHEGLARVALADGRARPAAYHALRAVRLLERGRVTVPPDEYMAGFLRAFSRTYDTAIEAVLAVQSPRSGERALRLSEQARSRALLDQLHNRRARSESERTSFARERRQIEQRLQALTGRMPEADPGSRMSTNLRRQEAVDRESERLRQLLREGGARASESMPNLDEIHASLPENGTLIEYYLDRSRLLIFIVDADRFHVQRVDISRDSLDELIRRLHFHLDRPQRLEDAMSPLLAERMALAAIDVLRKLYDVLIAPVADHVQDGPLVIVPHGSLHGLPFHALMRPDDETVGERHHVAQVPRRRLLPSSSATDRAARRAVRAAASSWASATRTRRTSRARSTRSPPPIALAVVRRGESADRHALSRDAKQAEILHIATHGEFAADDPLASGLLLGDGWPQRLRALRLRAGRAAARPLGLCHRPHPRHRGRRPLRPDARLPAGWRPQRPLQPVARR